MPDASERPEGLQQNAPEEGDVDCLQRYCRYMAEGDPDAVDRKPDAAAGGGEDWRKDCQYVDQVFVHEIHARDAAGPLWARGLLSKDLEAAHKNGQVHSQVCPSLRERLDLCCVV